MSTTHFVLLLSMMLPPVASAGAQDRILVKDREVMVWRPAGSAEGRQPVVIFSHGFGGCATQSRFLTEALAGRGYWVFAPNHRDARCGTARGRGGAARPDTPFRNPQSWSDRSYRDRAEDIRALRAWLAATRPYADRLDLDRLGLVGHSLGGYTVLGLVGGWSSWRLDHVAAVLALSPYAQPYLVHGTLSGLSAPVMYQGGTLDAGITPSLGRSGGVYDATPEPKYFVSLAGMGHFAWTDLRSASHGLILDYGVAFLDHYVRGQPAGATLTAALPGVAEVRYDSDLGHGRAPRDGVAGGSRRR